MLLGQEPGRSHLLSPAPGDPLGPPSAPSSPSLSAEGPWGISQWGNFLAFFKQEQIHTPTEAGKSYCSHSSPVTEQTCALALHRAPWEVLPCS